jgi:hypothetical protein
MPKRLLPHSQYTPPSIATSSRRRGISHRDTSSSENDVVTCGASERFHDHNMGLNYVRRRKHEAFRNHIEI